MRINQKVKYGVVCLFELSKNPADYQYAEQIARNQNIPIAYAQKVLQALAHAGMIISLKGVGYRLARPLGNITALEVMEALTADIDSHMANAEIGIQLERRVNQALGSFTLAELVRR